MKIRKQKQRNKYLNDLLLLKPAGKHDPKQGKHISRQKRKHLENKNKEERNA